jgi:hypothetical protein
MVKWTIAVVWMLSQIGCAHHGAVRASCDGLLRPVNAPIESHEPPVSVRPQDPAQPTKPERQP